MSFLLWSPFRRDLFDTYVGKSAVTSSVLLFNMKLVKKIHQTLSRGRSVDNRLWGHFIELSSSTYGHCFLTCTPLTRNIFDLFLWIM